VGDFIETNGFSGTVEAIKILHTTLKTVDNKVVYIPNCDKVKRVLTEIVTLHPLVLKDPEIFVRMSEHGDSAVGFTVRAWVNAPDYSTVYFDIIETVKKRFDEEGISIPYPQMDVHMQK
jgi:small conductance mechanosensitive channel